jgi:hypothetical protein
MFSLKEIAEVYKLGFNIEYFKVDDIIQWADSIIERDNKPQIAIIELSLSRGKSKREICDILSEIKGDFNTIIPTKIILGILYKTFVKEKNSIDFVSEFVELLYKLSFYIPDDDISYDLIALEDYFSVVKHEILDKDIQDVLNEIEKYLRKYKSLADDFLVHIEK